MTSVQYANYKIFAANPRWLKGAVLQQVASDLASALPQLKIRDYFKVKPGILSDSDHVTISRDKSGRVIGVLATKWYTAKSFRFLHIMTIFLAEDCQGSPLFKRMWNVHFRELIRTGQGFPEAFSLKTYNPISCSLLRQVARKSGAHFYPQLTGDYPQWLEGRAQEIADSLEPKSKFNPKTGVIEGGGQSVPEDFYPQIPKSSRLDIMSHFGGELTPNDRLLCCLFCEPTSEESILEQFGVPPTQPTQQQRKAIA